MNTVVNHAEGDAMALASRIRQYRTARGYSLDELVARMGGIVTKQALSKYERDRAVPRPTVLVALARALDIKTADLLAEPSYQFKVVAYRALSALPKREQEWIESRTRVELERRLALMDRLGLQPQFPFKGAAVSRAADVADAEGAAERLRKVWGLGDGPIANFAETLEDRGVHLVDVPTDRKFDGLAVCAVDRQGRDVACGIATRREVSRARQRINYAHETGHLAMRIDEPVDPEDAAWRFAGALLFPEESVRDEFGGRRNKVTVNELLIAKRKWGLSIQAVLYRLHDLGVIDDTSYRWWCMRINKMGWRQEEPGEEPPERSRWVDAYAHRAFAEGLIAEEAFAEYVPRTKADRVPGDIDRRALLKLPVAERRAILKAQADAIAEEYNAEIDHEWLAGDFEDG